MYDDRLMTTRGQLGSGILLPIAYTADFDLL